MTLHGKHSHLGGRRGAGFAGLISRVRAGAEIVIEDGAEAIAVIRTPEPPRLSTAERISLLPEDSLTVIDFPNDVEAAVAAHREPLSPPDWDSVRRGLDSGLKHPDAAERGGLSARRPLIEATERAADREIAISVEGARTFRDHPTLSGM
jgi:antitoxin (DNA-binding transcriptional repressor) of toxin-antitoxin stability system